MSLEDKLKATAKNLEGRAREALGNATGDPELQAEGKVQQIQASAMHAVEKVKEKAKDIIEAIEEKLK